MNLINLCSRLLSDDSAMQETAELPAQLAVFAREIGASAAAIALMRDGGCETVGLVAPDADRPAFAARVEECCAVPLEEPVSKGKGTLDAFCQIALGSVQDHDARLILDFAKVRPPAALVEGRALVAGIFRRLLACHLTANHLARQERQLADLNRFGRDWLWQTDADGILVFLSKNLDSVGLPSGSLMSHIFRDIVDRTGSGASAPGRAEMRERLLKREPFNDILHAIILPDDRRLWLRSSGAPQFDPDGSFAGYTGASTEVTKLVEQEREAKAAVEGLIAIMRALPHLSFEITEEGRYTDFLAGPADLMVTARETLPGKTLEEVLPPDVAVLARGALEEVLRTGTCAPLLYRLATDNYGLRWFSLTGARKASTDSNEQSTAIFVIVDVTEEVERNEEMARLGKIVEAMTNMVVVVDNDQCVKWVNKAWESRFGWKLDEVRGKVFGALVRPADANPADASAVRQAIEEGRSYRGETINVDRFGNRISIDFNIFPLRQSDGAIVGYVSVETDITALRESQQQAEEAAQAAERTRAQLHNAIETLPDGVVIWDADDRLVDVNTGYKDLYPYVAAHLVPGVSQDEILRIGVAQRAFPSAWGREEEWIAEQWQRYREPIVDEVQREDGKWIRRLDLRTADGGRIAVRIDTTERHSRVVALNEANNALAEARRALAQTLERAEIGAWEWDVDTGQLNLAGHYTEMLGYAPEEFGPPTYRRFRELVHPEDLAMLDATAQDRYSPSEDQKEHTVEQLFRMLHRNGSWVWIMSRTAVVARDENGTPKRLVGVHIDVTERRKLEEQIAERERFLTQVMEASISAIAVTDRNNVITYANAEAERLLELKPSTRTEQRYEVPDWKVQMLDGSSISVDDLPHHRALAEGKAVRDYRLALVWPDGRRRILSVNASGNADDDSFAIKSFIDITEDLVKAERLEQALAAAHEASQSKSTFLANMSHEIRTPLNGVLGMAEILDGLITEPRKKEMVRTIRRSGELLMNVLNDILDMSKIEAGKVVIEQIPFVPSEVARGIEALHQLRAEEKGLGFEVLMNSGASAPRLGDPLRLQQILNNLLSNAIKFTERGGITLVVSARPGQSLVLEVRDTGIGMTDEQVGRLFQSFEQAEAGTTRRFGGTGLGMAIVKWLVDRMDGKIDVKSEPGKGTEIRITLPLPEAEKTSLIPTATWDQDKDFRLDGVRILIADDSETNRRVIEEMLMDTGATMTFAVNGAEAVEAWQTMSRADAAPHLLILDIAMPVMDGKEALAAIRAISDEAAAVPAMAVTANAMAHHVTEYLMAGFDTHVPKPFRRAELLHAIRTLMPSS